MCECTERSTDEGLPAESDESVWYCLNNPGSECMCLHGDGAAIGHGMTDGWLARAPV